MVKIGFKIFIPPRVVIDHSWALIHAVAQGIGKTNVHDYLETCWKAVTSQSSSKPSTIISLCGAHVTHSFSSTLKHNGIKKDTAPGYMWLFARLQKAETLNEMETIFKKMCKLSLSRTLPKDIAAEIINVSNDATVEDDDSAQDKDKLHDDNERVSTGTYRSASFGRHFDKIKKTVAESVSNIDQPADNRFFCPSLIEHMLRSIMPLAPLWSRILSLPIPSNAAVESHFRIIKRQLLKSRTRLHPSDLVRKIVNNEATREKLDCKPGKPAPRGRKRTKNDINTETQEEQWEKRDPNKRPTWYARNKPPTCLDMRGEARATTKQPETPKQKVPKVSPLDDMPNKSQDHTPLARSTPESTSQIPTSQAKKDRTPASEPGDPQKAPSNSSSLIEIVDDTNSDYIDVFGAAPGVDIIDPSVEQHDRDNESQPPRTWGVLVSDTDDAMRCLEPTCWLNDEVLDSFCLAVTSATGGGAVSFGSHWINAMECGRTLPLVMDRLREKSAQNADIWLLPYNRNNNHWALFIVAFRHEAIIHVDSLYGPPDQRSVTHVQTVVEAAKRLKGRSLSSQASLLAWHRWRLVNPDCTPQQEDGFSCGPRVCYYAEIAATALPSTPFSDPEMRRHIRRTIRNAQAKGNRTQFLCLGLDNNRQKRRRFAAPALTEETDVGPDLVTYLAKLRFGV